MYIFAWEVNVSSLVIIVIIPTKFISLKDKTMFKCRPTTLQLHKVGFLQIMILDDGSPPMTSWPPGGKAVRGH